MAVIWSGIDAGKTHTTASRSTKAAVGCCPDASPTTSPNSSNSSPTSSLWATK